ncbi:MAG: hypothetical protein OEZ57_01250 [Nitrospirota bacterium]|nr:hypothetical protein [Nitrospirota bacterium]MDH5585075.1 hypothetical protein [Nitrospirota bacterium]MDH5773526.1 hypothetical protein [Nitrospirota bacterium]
MRTRRRAMFLLIAGTFLLSLFTSGIGTTFADTTITLDQSVHFTTAEGSDVVLDAGDYEVNAADAWLRVTPSEGQAVDALLLEAQVARHEETLKAPLGVSTQGESPDTHHLALLLPDGKRLEAIGSYSGIRSRGFSLLTLQRLRTLSSTTNTEFSTPRFGGSGGTRSYNLDCGSGSVMVGAIYKAGLWMDALGIICQQVNPQTGALEREFTRGPVGGSGGQARIARCRAGDVAQGIKAFSGQYINEFHMRCSRWEPSRKAPVSSQICNPGTAACLAFGGSGGAPSDLFFCPAGMAGKAFRGKYGLYVDSARFVCDNWDK